MIRLAVFDLDGTLKRARDPYVYLHRRLGTEALSKPITEKGKRGELAYEEWLRQDVSLWRGVPRRVLEHHLRQNPYVPGAREVVTALKEHGVEIAIISTGLLLHAELVAQELGVRWAIGNEIFFEFDGKDWVVNGEVRAHCPYNGKGEVLAQLQERLGVAPEQTLSVGDTRGDVPMFRRSRVSVAVAPHHEDVAAAATLVLPDQDLRPLLKYIAQWLANEPVSLNNSIDT